MKFSFQFRLFLGIAYVLFLGNLLLTNDYTTFWSGAESALLTAADKGEATWAVLPKMKASALLDIFGLSHFWLRLPSVCSALLSLIGFWFFGRKIFGERTTLVTILVLISSLAFPNLSKWATGDSWLFGAQLLSMTTMILYLKKPQNLTLFWHTVFVLIGSLTNPISMLLLLVPTYLYYYFRHPSGQNLKRLFSWFLPIFVLMSLYFLYSDREIVSGTLLAPFSISLRDYSLISILGMLPWIAFLPAAIIDMTKKLKRKEELSILSSGWLLGAILSFSLGLQAIFALLIAKQIEAFFHPNYPYANWVKTFAALNIVAAFIGGIFLMLNGFYALEMEGFRLGMSIGAVYWIPAFLAVVGIFGKNNRLITGGAALSGLLLTSFFWIRGGFVLETFRSTPQQVCEAAAATGKKGDIFFFADERPENNFFLYGRKYFRDALHIRVEDMQSIRPTIDDAIVFKNNVPENFRLSKNSQLDSIKVRGLNMQEELWLIKK